MRITLPLLVVCLSAASADAQTPAAAKPNVVLIVTDDVGYGDLGSYGAADIKTPNIDSLARDGVRLTDFYAAPQCTPTRAALISGRYQQRFRLEAAMPGPKTAPYNAAHWPFQVPDHPSVAAGHARFVQPEENDTATRKDYAAILERADQGIGRILQSLKQRGLDRNTLVVYMQDNGGEWVSRNAPLFNRKGTVWEGGIRVPAIFRWPGHLPAGKVSGQVGIVQDVTATILAATGTTVPAAARPEGINLLPILEGRNPALERTLFFRFGTGATKQLAVRQGSWKLLVDGAKRYVFDLSKDVGERNDLTNQRQDVAQRLRPLIAAWEADVDAEAKMNSGAATK